MDRSQNDRKARQNDDFDFVVHQNQRQHRRVTSSAFGNIFLTLTPAPPFFGDPLEGTLIDLSGGGMSVIVKEAVVAKTKMVLAIKFPFRPEIKCTVSVRRAAAVKGGTLLGLQFLDLSGAMADELARISTDTDACDERVRNDVAPVCVRGCAFFRYCEKPEKAA